MESLPADSMDSPHVKDSRPSRGLESAMGLILSEYQPTGLCVLSFLSWFCFHRESSQAHLCSPGEKVRHSQTEFHQVLVCDCFSVASGSSHGISLQAPVQLPSSQITSSTLMLSSEIWTESQASQILERDCPHRSLRLREKNQKANMQKKKLPGS